MHESKAVNLLLPYNEKNVIGTAERINNNGNYEIVVTFPDGYCTTFIRSKTPDITKSDIWLDKELGRTALSKSLEKNLDEFVLNFETYREPLITTVDAQVYFIQPVGPSDLTRYKIYHSGEYLFTIYISETGKYEVLGESSSANKKLQYYPNLIQILGRQIDGT